MWKRCNSCKKEIAWSQKYWVCNVSTCNRKRTGLIFCSVSCWDAHVPMMNHRESWAEERKAPTAEEWKRILEDEAQPRKRSKASPEAAAQPAETPAGSPSADTARGASGEASSARGASGEASSARGASGEASSARGASGEASSARGASKVILRRTSR
jgi:hypothetical protein